jgi:uncharacterized membrane protein
MRMKKFIDSLKSFLQYVDDGKFFRNPMKWLYGIIAIINIAAPIYLIVKAIDSGMFGYLGGWDIVVFIIAWLLLLAGFCLLGIFWWLRKDQISSQSEAIAEFPATPVFAHFVRTFGEWLGLLTGGVMFVVVLVMFILSGFKDGGSVSLFSSLLPFGSGIVSIIMMPVFGFIMILFFRFLSERIKVLVAIERNTKK